MVEEIDEVTLARARRGDPSALTALVRHYQRPVHALCARLLVGRGAARDDVAQESLIRVCRGLARYDPAGGARLSTWILTVTTRTCLNAIRDGRRAAARETADLDPASPLDPERSAADRELGRRVAAAVADLPEDLRAVLVLRAYHDFDYEQIAEAVGIELGTVKSRLSRARVALRQALRDEETELERA
jgi:RNA polymerase sigma-70 factor, ECF subfamily